MTIKNKRIMKYIVLIVITLVPFMYSFFYLKAFWDPYANINEIPVAIVNLDTSKENNKGEELINSIKEKNVLKITVTSNDKATKGLLEKDYYAVITIPDNFTENLKSAASEDKKLTTITYTPNQKSNYLASQIINKVISKVESELKSKIAKEVVNNLISTIEIFPDKIDSIVVGLNQLQNGINTLDNGVNDLSNGITTLNDNYQLFDQGIKSVSKGSQELASYTNQLVNSVDSLENGLEEFDSATSELSELSTKMNELNDTNNNLSTNLQTYLDNISNINNYYNNLVVNICTTEGSNSINCLQAEQIKLQLNQIVNANDTYKNSINGVKLGINSINDKTSNLNQINTNIKKIKNNVTKFKGGINNFSSNLLTLNNGIKNLEEKSSEIRIGISDIANGTLIFKDGMNSLLNGSNNFVNEINSSLASEKENLKKLSNLDNFVQNSVTIEEKDINSINEYGVAFAPYFMSLSLWVGSLMLFIVLYYDANDRFKLFSRNNKNKVKRTMGYMALAILQGIFLGILLKLGLNLNITNYLLYFGSLILVSNTFLFIVEYLIVNFDDIGKFIVILFLVLQLAASGGTFPIETVPTFFRNIYNFMPMKYAINLFKESIITIEKNIIIDNALVLIVLAVVMFMLIVITDIIKKKLKK